ncbi:MAG: hypothetical protein ACI9AQ_000741, partial [Dinoroseobacter sp.]
SGLAGSVWRRANWRRNDIFSMDICRTMKPRA